MSDVVAAMVAVAFEGLGREIVPVADSSSGAAFGDFSVRSAALPAELECRAMPRTLTIANVVKIRLENGMCKPSSLAAVRPLCHICIEEVLTVPHLNPWK